MTRGYISIGSNIDKEIHIPASLEKLKGLFSNIVVSSVYESTAIGFDGEKFHNMVVQFDSDLNVKQVTRILRQIELDHGRSLQAQKFSARTLDLDLILFGNLVINDGELSIPRDEIQRYAFVLEPLAEIAATVSHPLTGESFGQLWENFNKQGLQQTKIIPTWLLSKQTTPSINC